MEANEIKFGVVSCSGEECAGGTISRLATRKMMDEIQPDKTVTICLPLFLAGGQEERTFAEEFPTIAVDGCKKACAKRAIEKYSGAVNAAIVVSDLIGTEAAEGPALSTRELTVGHQQMIDRVADEISNEFDLLIQSALKK